LLIYIGTLMSLPAEKLKLVIPQTTGQVTAQPSLIKKAKPGLLFHTLLSAPLHVVRSYLKLGTYTCTARTMQAFTSAIGASTSTLRSLTGNSCSVSKKIFDICLKAHSAFKSPFQISSIFDKTVSCLPQVTPEAFSKVFQETMSELSQSHCTEKEVLQACYNSIEVMTSVDKINFILATIPISVFATALISLVDTAVDAKIKDLTTRRIVKWSVGALIASQVVPTAGEALLFYGTYRLFEPIRKKYFRRRMEIFLEKFSNPLVKHMSKIYYGCRKKIIMKNYSVIPLQVLTALKKAKNEKTAVGTGEKKQTDVKTETSDKLNSPLSTPVGKISFGKFETTVYETEDETEANSLQLPTSDIQPIKLQPTEPISNGKGAHPPQLKPILKNRFWQQA
jgi:hypothetical protein